MPGWLPKTALAMLLALLTAGPAGAQEADVEVELEQFGVGSAYRPGDFTGARLKLTSNLTEPTEVWVQWQVPNADGDVGEYGRAITLSQGGSRSLWLYAPIPPDSNNNDVWTVRVLEYVDGERRGRELGGTRISPALGNALMVEIDKAMIGVVGTRRMGLQHFNFTARTLPGPTPAHESIWVISNIKPAEMPDRWEALQGFEAIVWADATPDELRDDPAAALREYIRRGGHLVITLPPAGDPWDLAGGQRTQLWDLLPPLPRKIEGVPLSELLPVISKSAQAPANPDTTIHVFKQAAASDDPLKGTFYEPVIALPDGRVIVVQRTYGFGRITVIGFDVAEQRLMSMGLPQGDAFWNRILGRRADTPTGTELNLIDQDKRLSRRMVQQRIFGSGALFSQQISMSQEASLGLLIAVLLFGAYFVVAGPGGFFLLRAYGYVKHSWLAFVAAAVVFTAAAWGSSTLLRVKDIAIRHVTFLDQIARPLPEGDRAGDPQLHRATSFFSVYLPGYRPTPIAIASEPGHRDLLASWSPPGQPRQTFPNVSRYVVDVARTQSSYGLPARATATQLYAHYHGGPDRPWGSLFQVDPADQLRELPRTLGQSPLAGTIRHSLPGPLVNVKLIHVSSNRTIPTAYAMLGDQEQPWVPQSRSGQIVNTGSMWAIPAIDPDTPLDLEELLDPRRPENRGTTELGRNITELYVRDYRGQMLPGMLGAPTALNPKERRDFMEILTLFNQLTPPDYLRSPSDSDDPETLLARRELGRELDLSMWFTRPCVIIIGYVEDSPLPVPVRLGGDTDPPNSSGLTVVRWIHPLPLDEAAAFAAPVDAGNPEGESP